MKKGFLIVISSVFLLTGCQLKSDKTIIKIHLSEAEYIHSMAINADDSVFNAAYNFALENSDSAGFLPVFEKKYTEICPDCMLASLFSSFELRDKISFDNSNQEVITALKEEVKLAMVETILVLKKRIESFCKPVSMIDRLVKKTKVSVDSPERNTWTFTVNRNTDGERLATLLQTHVKCGFWETYELSEIWDNLSQANHLLSDPSMAAYTGIKTDTSKVGAGNALFTFLKPSVGQDGELIKGSVIGYSEFNDILTVNNYLTIPAVKNLLPRDLRFMWAKMPFIPEKEIYMLVALKVSSRDGLPLLDEGAIAASSINLKKYPLLLKIMMNTEGARMLSLMTRDNIGRQIVFEINDKVISNATVLEEINGGEFVITGGLPESEISDVDVLLNSGIMPKVGVSVISIL